LGPREDEGTETLIQEKPRGKLENVEKLAEVDENTFQGQTRAAPQDITILVIVSSMPTL